MTSFKIEHLHAADRSESLTAWQQLKRPWLKTGHQNQSLHNIIRKIECNMTNKKKKQNII